MIADPCIAICADRCAEFGDPACWPIALADGQPFKLCDDCLRDAGIEPVEAIDPAAAIGVLL